MNLDRHELVAGVPILTIRDYLRWLGNTYSFQEDTVAIRLKLSKAKSRAVWNELLRRQWIEPDPNSRGEQFYRKTMAGRALAGARAVPRMKREKAERLLAEFLARVREINADDAYTEVINEVRIFGSYLTKSETLGDLDLAVEFAQRQVPGRDIVRYVQERADAAGAGDRSFIERLAYGELEVRRKLKARSPYISIHPLSDIKQTGSKSRLLYRR